MAVDRIRELQRLASEQKRQRIEEAARKERERERERLSVEQTRRLEEARKTREAEERRQLIRMVTDDVLKRSGVIRELKSIGTELLGKTAKHALVINLDKANASLVWGSRFQVNSEGEIERQTSMGGLLKDLVLDFSFIGVDVNPDTQAIRINGGKEIAADEWRADNKVV